MSEHSTQVVTLTTALKISHTVFVTMLSPVQCSTHFFKQFQALPQTSSRLFITKIGHCTYTHTLSLLCWENVNQLKKNTHTDPSQALTDYSKIGWKPLEILVAKPFTIFPRKRKHIWQNTVSWTRQRLSCWWVLQMHERNALMSFSISTTEREDNANSSVDIIKMKSKEIIISSTPVDDSLQFETAQRHICTSISSLKHKARWGSSKSLL